MTDGAPAPAPPTDEEIRREFLWMWDPFHSVARGTLTVLLLGASELHGVLFDPSDPVWVWGPVVLVLGFGGLSAWCRWVVRSEPPERMRKRCEKHATGNTRLLPILGFLAGLVLAGLGAVVWVEWTLWRQGRSPVPFRASALLIPLLAGVVLRIVYWYWRVAIPRSRQFLARLRGASTEAATRA